MMMDLVINIHNKQEKSIMIILYNINFLIIHGKMLIKINS